MKRLLTPSRLIKKAGFTLIELLVVMGIIAILAAVLFPAGAAAINAAKRAKANATASNIQTAVLAYNTEYSIYPVPTSTTTDTLILDTTSGGAAWATLDCVLCGNIEPSNGMAYTVPAAGPTNTRGIAFLNLKSSDVYGASAAGTQDSPKNPLPSGTSISFNIAMDSDYDGVLGVAPSSVLTMPNFSTSTTGDMVLSGGTSTAGVAVWANCNGNTTTTTQNPAFYVHTY